LLSYAACTALQLGEPLTPPGVTPGDPDTGERDIVTTASGISYADVVPGRAAQVRESSRPITRKRPVTALGSYIQ
jgi:hypothetical protein